MRTIVIDFETRWGSGGYSLSKISTEAYIRDPRFKAFGLAWKELSSGDVPTWVSGDKIQAWVDSIDWANTATVAHNAMFDNAILAWRFGAVPAVVFDSLSMARAVNGVDVGGSLAKLADMYGLPPKGNAVYSTDGLEELPPYIEAELAEYCKHDVFLCEQVFLRLMAGFPKAEARLIDLTIRMFIEPKLVLDKELLEEHLRDVKAAKTNLLISSGIAKDDLMSNPKFAAILRSFGVEPPMKISKTTGKETYAFAKTDEGIKELLNDEDPRVQAVVAARLGVKSTLEETRTEAFLETASRGLLPIPLKYWGARTGRWSGEVYNMQNLPRASQLKYAIKAPDGYALVGLDLSNIELRVGLWLAGQEDKLSMLGGGADLYKAFASAVFDVPYDEVTPEQRFIGKTCTLSLIYGVGHLKLRDSIKIGSGKDIGIPEAKRIVNLYRDTHKDVTRAWREGESALEAVMLGAHIDYMSGVVTVEGARGCRLPSGMYMQYPELSKVLENGKSQWVYKTRKGVERLYGAKVFQGLTQALARCIMGDGIRRTAKRYPVVLTIHDAEYLLAPEGEAEQAMAFAHTCLCTPPSWAPALPLAAEGGYGPTLGHC